MITSIPQLIELRKTWKTERVGLITGCFDVLHIDHVTLFEFAKEHVEIVLIGLDSDKAITLNKGKSRPIFSQEVRMKVIDAIATVDYVFPLSHTQSYSSSSIDSYFTKLYTDLKITHLITDKQSDSSWINKQSRANKLGIEMILRDEGKNSSSSDIIEKLGL